jgi:tetratricopeptide (TPR) repeat protein
MTTLIEPRAESGPEAAPVAASGAGTSCSVARGIFRTPGIAAALCGERWWLRATLALLFALYVRAIGFAPVYDDNVISPWSGGWSDVPKFFTHDIFGSNTGAGSVYYRPLALLWGFLLTQFTGGAPGWLHLAAIFLHLAVVALAYLFGRRLFGNERLALLTALLFGLHPSKVESVAWIGSSNVDGVGGVFFFASLIAFLQWREMSREMSRDRSREMFEKPSGAGYWWAGSVALFAGALFTKETMVCIPVLIAAWLWLTFPKTTSLASRAAQSLRTLLPYGVVWAVYMAIRHQVIKPAGASADYIHPTFTLGNLWTAPYSIGWYLRHLAMPWGLSVEYAPVVIDHPTLRNFFLPAAGLAGLSLAAWWLWRRQRSAVAAFLGFWFVINLAPPVIVAPMVSQHDRYLYLSAYAFCALLAWAILNLGRLPNKGRLVVALCVVALWSGLTWHEMGYWDDDMTLWGRVLQISPSNIKAQVQMASLYQEAGNTPKALSILDDGLRYRPDSPGIWLARAGIFSSNNQKDAQRAAYLKVMQVTEPAAGQAVQAGPRAKMRASAAYQLALMDNAAKNFTEAEPYARTAISLRYDGVGYHSELSESLRGEGRIDEATRENALEMRLRMAQQRANGTLPASVRE